jgi:hypothetical protein
VNTIQEVALIERLGQIADDSSLKCAGTNIIARIGSYQYGGNLFAQSRQIVVQIKATHLGHVEVDNQSSDCVSNRFVVIDYGNYSSAIWHLARPVCTENSNSDVVMVKPAEDGL